MPKKENKNDKLPQITITNKETSTDIKSILNMENIKIRHCFNKKDWDASAREKNKQLKRLLQID